MQKLFFSLLMIASLSLGSEAADWPMYRGNAARQGYSSEELPTQLALAWHYQSLHQPQPAWPRDGRMSFDRAYHVTIANGVLYYGSSVDGKVYALDAKTGEEKWTFFTEGPIRFAPAVWEDQVFVASDDGHLYSLSTVDGSLNRKWRGGPDDERVLGNSRIVSRWPARGGPVVLDGIVYYAAGIWQSEGIYIYAIDTETGKTIWVNNDSGGLYMAQPHGGAYAKSGVSAQGHFVVQGDYLLVPTGRAVPAVFNRKDGKFMYYHLQQNTKRGGTSIGAFGDVFVNNGIPFEMKTGNLLRSIGAGPVSAYSKGLLSSSTKKLTAIAFGEKETKDRKGKATKVLDYSTQWSVDGVAGGVSLIVAGETAIVGSHTKVTTVDLKTKKVLQSWSVDGVPYGLAAADGRVYVSTDQGSIYCFSAGTNDKPVTHRRIPEKSNSSKNTLYARAASEIIEKSNLTAGYCFDLGCGDGSLAYELAQRSKLRICAIDSDPEMVRLAREKLDAAGFLGSRVMVFQADMNKTRFPKFVANLLVSGRSVIAGSDSVDSNESARLHRPYGGIACYGKPGEMNISKRGALAKAGSWTHQYMNAANTLCTTDEVKGPLRALWYRDVDLEMPSRHGRGPSPLFHEGRLFVEGMDALRGVDAYNGRTLWEFELKGILHPYSADHIVGTAGTGSNLCAAGDSVYVRQKKTCYRLDAATGKVLGEFPALKHKDGKQGTWGYIACLDGILYGSIVDEKHIVRHAWRPADMSKLFTESKTLFAIDAKTGELKWRYDAEHSIRNNAIAIGDGRVFLIDRPIAVNDLLNRLPKRRGEKPENESESQPTGEMVCLDTKTGKEKWRTSDDIYGTMLAFSKQFDLLLMSYQSTRFKLPSEVGGRMAVFRADEGYRIWDKKVQYRTRPLINERTIIAEGAALDLLNGEAQPFDFKRSYGCGQLAGSKNLLLFRSATLGYFDFSTGDKPETQNFGGMRPGCWVNALPVGGLVLVPDASAGCSCSYQNRSWVALQGSE